MDHADALSRLEKGNLRQRLQAARTLRADPRASDREALMLAARREKIPRIRRVIEDTLTQIAPALEEEAANDVGLAAKDSAARAVKEMTSTVVHEVSKLLPPLRYAAEQDIPSFAESATKGYIDRLDALVDAIQRLGRAASAPVMTDFDLAALIREVVENEATNPAILVQVQGPSPLLVVGDRNQVALALSNGLRNAIESALEADTANPSTVVVAWDQTDTEYWVVILDRGVGLPPGYHRAFEFGRSSKQKHAGAGLAIAKQAVESLGGSVQLGPREGGGASYEVKWPRPVSIQ
jgi:signal transduction histidine kinase